ncbi:Coiled-coil domain containing protein 152 [Dissostichus eleginoides]|uniref:Coiled-coil domain containing protein 152 n=1 Tax=Dissostichus eleginoides TaxID=100907 RepID=A0AAD9BJF4_DISEL|nr:Coiled-coil domain containing protein 152 [Dissostichus eleginoides]
MIKLNCVHLDRFMDDFSLLEQKMAEVNGKNNMFEIMLEDASRQMKFYQTKEKSLIEERDSLLVTVNRLQQTLQEQCNLRVETERLESKMASLKQHNERAAEDTRREGLHQLEAKDAEVKSLLEKRDLDLGELKRRLKDQERERQSELLKLQMEFGAKLARSVFKRKLQFFQEEKNKEIAVLRQRIKALEENQRVSVFRDSRLKKRKI